MNITEKVFDFKQRGNVEGQAPLQSSSELEATVTFDKDGRIERFPLFQKLFLTIIIILVATLSFGIGRLSVAGDRGPVRIEYDQQLTTHNSQRTTNINQTASVINTTQNDTAVVVSKNGTKYHYSHCGGAKQIKEENKIVFQTPEAAEIAGYTLAGNCSPR
jgi:hypothetical protein